MNRKMFCALCVTFIILVIPQAVIKADMGPKPVLIFMFKFENPEEKVENAEIFLCADIACKREFTERSPVPNTGPWINCEEENQCVALVYENPVRFKLIAQIGGRKLESNGFTKTAFQAYCLVKVSEEDLAVEEVSPNLAMLGESSLWDFCFSLTFNLIVEGILGLIVFLIIGKPRMILWLVLANVVSLGAIWFPLRIFTIPIQ